MPHSVLVDQAAALLGVSRRTIYYRIREGKLSTFRTRCGSQRVLMASLQRLMRETAEHRPQTPPRPARADTRRAIRRPAASGAAPAPKGPDDLTMVQDAGV
jgi:excisionase family DNA binding protein